jgi:two-component sensor histidine kinase
MSTRGQLPERAAQWIPSLSGEADHRIANSLAMISSLVRLRATKAKAADDGRTFLMEIADRIETVAQLHRLVARSGNATVQLSKHLREICERLSSALTTGGVSFSVVCSPEHIVPFTMALPLGLITAELYSNSLKYAHPASVPVKITLSCVRSGKDRMIFAYEDDGVGFPEDFDIENDGHQGMRFIRLLSKQLAGTHEWQSDPLGIRFEISIPNSAACANPITDLGCHG